MDKRVIFLILGLSLPLGASAVVLGGSNLSFNGYPSMDCTKPQKPIKPFSLSDQWEVDSYNAQVDEYNSDMDTYLQCVQEYIDNANNDIKRIKEKVQEAVDEANN